MTTFFGPDDHHHVSSQKHELSRAVCLSNGLRMGIKGETNSH